MVARDYEQAGLALDVLLEVQDRNVQISQVATLEVSRLFKRFKSSLSGRNTVGRVGPGKPLTLSLVQKARMISLHPFLITPHQIKGAATVVEEQPQPNQGQAASSSARADKKISEEKSEGFICGPSRRFRHL